MNPSNIGRLRPRDRASPGPSPQQSPSSSRRSGSLPAATFSESETQQLKVVPASTNKKNTTLAISPTIKVTSDKTVVHECIEGNQPLPEKKLNRVTRTRSGSWGGAYESEEEINVVQNNNDQHLNIEDASHIRNQGHNSEQSRESLIGGSLTENQFNTYEQQDGTNNVHDNSYDKTECSEGNKMEDELRRRLAFHFMNPVEKFIARRQVPWKLLLQFLKVILVTAQLLVFGYYRYAHSNYYSDNRIGFEHLFLGKQWDPVREIDTYPPSTGTLAIYNKEKFYEMFNSTVAAFNNMENITVNPIFKNSSFKFCIESFRGGGKVTKDLIIPPEMDMQVTEKHCMQINDSEVDAFMKTGSHKYLDDKNFTVPWDTMIRMHFNFNVTTVTYRRLGTTIGPECFRFGIVILMDNSDHDGQIPISLQTLPQRLRCPRKDGGENTIESISVRLLNLAVIVVCLVSLILCCRALSRAQKLGEETKQMLNVRFNIQLTFSEMWQFLNLWYVLICINDLLLITGSVITEMLETKKTTGDLWDFCSIFLGTGNLLVWIGMLRYLGFFEKYNALILTLKGAFPNVARFVICAGLVYCGYTFCGWIVFAPYHFKFRTLGSTSECLFSLINGDDMFATFSMLPQKLGVVHEFSRLFLYSFVMLFIYVVLSLFIAIIMDTYDNIKTYYTEGFPRSRIDQFYTAVPYDPYSERFFDGSSPSLLYNCWANLMLRCYGKQWQGYQRHHKSRSRQHNNTSNYNNRSNSIDINNHEQSRVANNEDMHNSQAQDALNSIPDLDEEPIIIVADTSISSTTNDRTPLL